MRTRHPAARLRGLVLAIAACVATPVWVASARPEVPAQPGPGRVDAAVAARVDAAVAQVMQRFNVPGAAIAVVQDGQRVYANAYGLRDVERALPVRTDTPFEIGSITKQFTAAAIIQLAEAGKLGLDDRLQRFLPQAPHASEVTLRQLLTHTSGLHDYFDGPEHEVDAAVARPIAFDALIARIADKPLDFPPGARWAYSNTGYALLGRVVEVASGERYPDYLRRHMLEPLQMTHTFSLADTVQSGDGAVGYRHEGGTLRRAPALHPDWSGAAGFLVSTLDDLTRWDVALSSGQVVSREGYALMTTPFVTADGDNVGYGLGLFVSSVYGQPRIGHTGGSQGFTTADEVLPGQRLRVLAFTNLGDKTPEAGITISNVVVAALRPDLVAAWKRPVAGEDAAVSAGARASFLQLQEGAGYGAFSESLRGRLSSGLGAGFSAALRPYGPPTAWVFQGTRATDKGPFHEYVAEFGSGVFLPYAIRPDAQGNVAGFALD